MLSQNESESLNGLFDLPFPLGEIIYEKNYNYSYLSQLNMIKNYIDFVNEVQQATFNGTRENSKNYQVYSREYTMLFDNKSNFISYFRPNIS